jgi:hypothetical protein
MRKFFSFLSYGKTWRLHAGKNAKIVLEISREDLQKVK